MFIDLFFLLNIWIPCPLIFKDEEDHSFSYYIHGKGKFVEWVRFEIDGKTIPFDCDDIIPEKRIQKDGSIQLSSGCSFVTWHLDK